MNGDLVGAPVRDVPAGVGEQRPLEQVGSSAVYLLDTTCVHGKGRGHGITI